MKFDLEWVHMARDELILRQVRAIWLRTIFKPLLTPKRPINDKDVTKIPKDPGIRRGHSNLIKVPNEQAQE